jgi:phage tail sheath protein FI
MAYKTPGVYIEEITSFPPSVVAVETAIPAFIGYTEKAQDENGDSLSFSPKRIKSLLEYEQYFGGDFVPDNYRVTLDRTNDNAVTAIVPRDESDTAIRYYMYGTLRHFYANGGGPCYIVSVGSYTDAPAAGSATTPLGLLGGLARLERHDEPTMLLFPDGVSLTDEAELGSVQVAALDQCAKLQDRFTVMDLMNGDQAASISLDPVDNFRNETGTSNLKYGAAYYPWLNTIYKPAVTFNQLEFFDQADAAISDNDIDGLFGDIAEEDSVDALTGAARTANATVETVVDAVDVSAMSGAGALTLTRDNFSGLMDHYRLLLDAVRQSDSTNVPEVRAAFGNLMVLPRAIALALPVLNGTTLGDELDQMVTDLAEDTGLVGAIIDLVSLERNSQVRGAIDSARQVADVEADYAALNATVWIEPNADVSAIAANTDSFGGSTYDRAMNAGIAVEAILTKLSAAVLSMFESAEFLADEAEKKLFKSNPVFTSVLEQINKTMGLLPASGAVAGVYASVDRTRGVWKAPANVSIADIRGPAVKLNDQIQGDLNVHTTGKSVNAIRAFTGKGSLIWGARTLDGNSNEWRYVSVRRFFNMAEESIKKATAPFTFEPNDANTWIRVRAMIENFLTIQWRNGALAGATAQQAFYVRIGLGETMTSQDILEGRMVIEIGMAVVRPAEFIVLKFAHKMQVA